MRSTLVRMAISNEIIKPKIVRNPMYRLTNYSFTKAATTINATS